MRSGCRQIQFIVIVFFWTLAQCENLTSGTLPSFPKGGDLAGFIENKGQFADYNGNPTPQVFFRANLQGVDLLVTQKGLSYVFKKVEENRTNKTLPHLADFFHEEQILDKRQIHYRRVDLNLIGGTIKREHIIKETPLPGNTNFYLSHCPEGIRSVEAFKKVTIQHIYRGIDWVLYCDEQGLFKYDFVVHPNADPSQIQLLYEGGEDFDLKKENKSLALRTAFGELLEGDLYCYTGQRQNSVKADYQLDGQRVSFALGDYDPNTTLVIDPPLQLRWATCYGNGSSESWIGATDIVTDRLGNVYMVGYAGNLALPTQDAGSGAYFQGVHGGADSDVFILKFNAHGQRLWATYYGGNSFDYGGALAVDLSDHLYVTGRSMSMDFPTFDPGGGAYFQEVNSGLHDVFVLKFNPQGQRLWATNYGGGASEMGNSMAVDDKNQLYLTGYTWSFNFPTLDQAGGYFQETNGGFIDAFVVKFNEQGQQLWSTYYGGEGIDYGNALALNTSNQLYLTGHSLSEDFPTYNPGGSAHFQGSGGGEGDAYVVKFDESGQQLWSTYYGGNYVDYADDLVIDDHDNLYLGGYSVSTDLPMLDKGGGAYYDATNAGGYDAFIAQFDAQGQLIWGTYCGGNSQDFAYALALDKDNHLFVTGYSESSNFPTLDPGSGAYFQPSNGGNSDVFILEFNERGHLTWSTYYGGAGLDWGNGVAVSDTCVFFTGEVTSTTDPVTLDPGGGAYHQSEIIGENNAFLLKFCTCEDPVLSLSSDTAICAGESAIVSASGGEYYLWENGATDSSMVIFPLETGYFSVEAYRGACSQMDSIQVVVHPLPAAELVGDTLLCNGDSTLLTASGGQHYLWNTGDTAAQISANPPSDSLYSVEVFNDFCSSTSTLLVEVVDNPQVAITGDTSICYGESTLLTASGALNYIWNNGDTVSSILVAPEVDQTYVVTGSIQQCWHANTVSVEVKPTPTADFSYSPSPAWTSSELDFLDGSSTDAISWNWDFGDGFSTLQYPTHSYEASGVYEVSLKVSNAFNCVDSVLKLLTVVDDYSIFLPSAFTPNGDGLNDEFHLQGDGLRKLEVELMIFNRWGELVFQTNDFQQSWQGMGGDGSMAPDGVYSWKLRYHLPQRKPKVRYGQLTLLR